ncbi:hypothetical protein KUV86_09790 [Halomonas sp. DP8Y7-3]|uniref:hypothetical protein n=1 Tax=Halomonas sp. DP8Y7-3 TaxID=2859079 RepID=UPI001C93769E|nr:hypothetical protein [Halomonas sp. DP8Y7-3]MBY5929399.1 hypothetical protein [Halomonas sp. DP8Y7-3]
MNRTVTLSLAALTLTGAFATSALADDRGISREELDRLLTSTGEYGFASYDELGVDDGHRFEAEGWRDDGWRLDVDMSLDDASILREQQREGQLPEWSLSGDEVSQALDAAQQAGLELFGSLDVDRMGDIEIEGYDAQHQEIEIRLDRDTFDVTGVQHDD